MEITIRRAEPGDHKALQRISAGPKVVRGTLQLPFPSAEQWRQRLTEPREGEIRLVACVDDEPVGYVALHTFPNHPRRRHVGRLGMAVRDDWQGRGIGTALVAAVVDLADSWLNLKRLELTVYTDNRAAIQLYQRFGFVTEGTLHSYAFRDGAYVDVLTMARVRTGEGGSPA